MLTDSLRQPRGVLIYPKRLLVLFREVPSLKVEASLYEARYRAKPVAYPYLCKYYRTCELIAISYNFCYIIHMVIGFLGKGGRSVNQR